MVSVVLDCLASGMKMKEIMSEYPGLSDDAIRAAFAYSAALTEEVIDHLSHLKMSGHLAIVNDTRIRYR